MDSASRVAVTGVLAPHAVAFRDELSALGYTPRSAETHLVLMKRLSAWLEIAGVEPAALTAEYRGVPRGQPRATVALSEVHPWGYATRHLPAPKGCRPCGADGGPRWRRRARRAIPCVSRRRARPACWLGPGLPAYGPTLPARSGLRRAPHLRSTRRVDHPGVHPRRVRTPQCRVDQDPRHRAAVAPALLPRHGDHRGVLRRGGANRVGLDRHLAASRRRCRFGETPARELRPPKP